MFDISSFLKKFSIQIDSSEEKLEIVCAAIEKYTGVRLEKTHIEFKDGIIRIKTSPAIKNKIFIYKKAISEDMASRGVTALDIR
jgi:hypothetical protein